jgi:pilus assembly protein TadC
VYKVKIQNIWGALIIALLRLILYNRGDTSNRRSTEGPVMIPDILRTLLLTAILSMAFLSFFYLSRRRLSWNEYLLLGLFSALVPVFGPFLVIALRPGVKRQTKGA